MTTKNPFGKSRDKDNPYAIYEAGDFVFHVCKTYQRPDKEEANPYGRWFVWAKSPMTYGSFEGGDMYIKELLSFANVTYAEPEWVEAYGIDGEPGVIDIRT